LLSAESGLSYSRCQATQSFTAPSCLATWAACTRAADLRLEQVRLSWRAFTDWRKRRCERPCDGKARTATG
jgi:hypothetical protein